jgi:hypothetical protein
VPVSTSRLFEYLAHPLSQFSTDSNPVTRILLYYTKMKLFLTFVHAAAVLVSFASYANAVKFIDDEFAADFARDVEGPQREMPKQQHRDLNALTSNRWKDRTGDLVIIPYTISPTFSSTEKSLIESSIKSLADRSKVVQFVPRTNQNAFIVVTNDAAGCFSNVGRSYTGSSQVLNLGNGCVSFGIIQHEFIHAVRIYPPLHIPSVVMPSLANFFVCSFLPLARLFPRAKSPRP